MKGSQFVFDYVHLLHYKCHKINLDHGGSYIDSPDWIKNKKATINPINKKDKKEKNISCLLSKHNSNREKQVTPSMIPNGEGWHYLAVKKLSALLKGITSKKQT